MFIKTGINSTRAEKNGPVVQGGLPRTAGKTCKIVRCPSCKKSFEKSCSSELACEISSAKCPTCGETLE